MLQNAGGGEEKRQFNPQTNSLLYDEDFSQEPVFLGRAGRGMTGYPMGSSSSMLIMVLLSGVKLVGLWIDWRCFCLVPVLHSSYQGIGNSVLMYFGIGFVALALKSRLWC